MRRGLLLTFTIFALMAAACPASGPGAGECADACAVALRCGILPSTLAGARGDGNDEMYAECVERCTASEPSEPITKTLDCLTPHVDAGQCAVDACTTAMTCLHEELKNGVVGAPEVTFKLIDGAIWSLLFQPVKTCGYVTPELAGIDDEEIEAICADQGPCPPGAADTAPQLRLPLCREDVCNSEDGLNCDDRLCFYEPAPTYDCAIFGIETVQFGYFDEKSVLHLDPTIYTCAQAGQGHVVPDIDSRIIYPVAKFGGRITSLVINTLNLPESAEGHEFCWLSHPSHPLELGWLVQAGRSSVAVPAPSSAQVAARIDPESDLLPRGCGCLVGQVGCEDAEVNKNCGNGIDDDLDGLADGEDPGCAS